MMTRMPECVWPQDTLQEAAARMKEMKIDPLPVCDQTHIVGMLTDRDIAGAHHRRRTRPANNQGSRRHDT